MMSGGIETSDEDSTDGMVRTLPKCGARPFGLCIAVLRKNGSGTTMFPQMDAWTKVFGRFIQPLLGIMR